MNNLLVKEYYAATIRIALMRIFLKNWILQTQEIRVHIHESVPSTKPKLLIVSSFQFTIHYAGYLRFILD